MSVTEILTKEYNACPDELCQVRKAVATACLTIGYNEQDINAIVLAIDEAYTNIIRYAYKNCQNGKVTLQILTDSQQTIFRLHDYADKVPADCLKTKSKDLMKPGGLGVMLMKQIMDWVGFVDSAECQGNILELKKNLPLEKQ